MKAQILYISHGGGPLPLLGDEHHRHMVAFLKKLSTSLVRPDAIVVVSAHWECAKPTVLSSAKPGLLYDYYGFPKQAYEIQYPAPGAVDLAREIASLLDGALTDEKRGFDHGMFIPLSLIYPDASIPTTQLSLLSSLSSLDHWNLGEALRPLLDQNILFIGSGFSFHNMRRFCQQSSGQQTTGFYLHLCKLDILKS